MKYAVSALCLICMLVLALYAGGEVAPFNKLLSYFGMVWLGAAALLAFFGEPSAPYFASKPVSRVGDT